MFFCMNISQTTFLDKPILTNIWIKYLTDCTVMAWLNNNNTASFSKSFKFLPLSFDIFVSIE